MDTGIVDLYQQTGTPRPQGAAGRLQYYIPKPLYPDHVRPAVLIIPGGGFDHVSAREGEPVALEFAAAGYGAFVLDYTVGQGCWPACIREAAMAMAFIRRNAQRFSLDPKAVAAVGFSAGGWLCGALGTMFSGACVKDMGIAPDTIRPDALGLCYPVVVSDRKAHSGSFDNLAGENWVLRQWLSLEKHVHWEMPPTFLWHTWEDETVPVYNSLQLASAMEEAGVPFALHIFHKGRHGLSLADERVYPVGEVPPVSADLPEWVCKMQDFFAEFGFGLKRKEEAQ